MSATTFLRRRNYAGDICKNEEFPAATFGKAFCIFRYLEVAKNTRAEGVNSWHTNEEDHNGYTGTNSRSYVYTTPNPPSNPYCEAILTATDEKGDEYAVWKGTLRDAK